MEKLFNEEDVILKGPANHMFKGEGVGGKVYLTKEYLFFVSHSININNHTYKIPLENIRDFNCPALLPTALKFKDDKGNTETFILYKRKKWIAKIEELQLKQKDIR